MLTHLVLHFSSDSINRGVEDQRLRVTTGHLHRDTLESALEIVRQEEHNIHRRVPKKGNPQLVFWYVNASSHTYVEGTGENAVTKTRVNAFCEVEDTACSVEAFVERHRSLHCVVQHFRQPRTGPSTDSCSTVLRSGPATVTAHTLWRCNTSSRLSIFSR
jgi:hypothetical protein